MNQADTQSWVRVVRVKPIVLLHTYARKTIRQILTTLTQFQLTKGNHYSFGHAGKMWSEQ
jgi:hypothetical protein